ncbi:MAG: nucleoid-associated protein YejK [Aeromonas sp.]
MSLLIEQITICALKPNQDGLPSVDTHSALAPTDATVQDLMSELHRIYNGKGGKGFAFFAHEADPASLADANATPAPNSAVREALTALLKQEIDFAQFTQTVTANLVSSLTAHALSEQGVVLLAKYNYVGADYLMLALLEGKSSISVDERLALTQSNYLDIGKLNVVARIDLTQWQTETDSRRYITYSQGRIGRKLGPFFIDLFGASEGMNAKAQNKGLLQAVDEFCEQQQLPAPDRLEYKKQVADYCQAQASSGEEIELKALCSELPSGESDFYSFIGQEYALEERFPADKTTLRGLTKFVGSGGGLNVSFEQKLLNSRIFYDAATDTLTIQGVPPNLKDQLLRHV